MEKVSSIFRTAAMSTQGLTQVYLDSIRVALATTQKECHAFTSAVIDILKAGGAKVTVDAPYYANDIGSASGRLYGVKMAGDGWKADLSFGTFRDIIGVTVFLNVGGRKFSMIGNPKKTPAQVAKFIANGVAVA